MVPLCPSSPRADPSCYSWWPCHRTWGLSASNSKDSITLSLPAKLLLLPPTTFPAAGCSPPAAPFPQKPQGPEVAQGAASGAPHSDKPPLKWAREQIAARVGHGLSKHPALLPPTAVRLPLQVPLCSRLGQPRPLKLQCPRKHLICIETQSVFKQSSSYTHSINWILNNIKNTV